MVWLVFQGVVFEKGFLLFVSRLDRSALRLALALRLSNLRLLREKTKVVSKKSIPAQIRQLILYYTHIKITLTDVCGN